MDYGIGTHDLINQVISVNIQNVDIFCLKIMSAKPNDGWCVALVISALKFQTYLISQE